MDAASELALFKAHCRADDFDGDDALLAFYLGAAKELFLGKTGRTEAEMEALGSGEWPRDAWLLVMSVGAAAYAQREAAAGARVFAEPVSGAILMKYRVFK